MSVSLTVSDWDGSNRQVLDAISQPASLSYSSAWPGGDATCSFTLALPVDADPGPLRLGNRITVYDGPVPVWAGMLADPQRGDPWQCTAQGLSSLADRFLPITNSPLGLTTNPNTAVNNAISRGLPWQTVSGLPTPSVSPDWSQPDQVTLGWLLDQIATASGMRWGVDPTGLLTMTADPTTPAYLLIASQTPGGRTTDDYATDLYAEYGTGTPPSIAAAAGNPSTPGPFGRWERLYDATNIAGTSGTVAASTAGNVLSLVGPDPSFTGTITVQPGDMQTLGGQPVRLSTVRAGTAVKCLGTQPDPTTGQLLFTTSVQLVIGEWEYDAVADTAQLTPVNATRRDLTAVLSQALSAN